MDVNNQRKPLLYYWLIALLIMGVINMFFLPFMTKNTIEQVNYDVFLTQMQNKNISQAEVNEDVIYFYLKDEGKSDKAGTTIFSENTQKVYSTVRMDDPQLVERLYNAGASFGEVKPREVSPWFSTLVMFVVFFLLWQFVIRKGCKIAAIKAGSSESGSRAASSHTGAIASSDSAVEALFRKAGIVRCFSREELTTVGCVFTLPELKGKNFAIITHAGGPGVMLTDALSKGGLNVPKLEGNLAEELKAQLFPGAAVGNPIDILATGTPEHLRLCIDYCEEKFENIDAVMAIFGTPGLVTMFEMYDVLHEKMQVCSKPIFPVLPSINTAGAEVAAFLAKGHVNFSDEVTLGPTCAKPIEIRSSDFDELELASFDPELEPPADSPDDPHAVSENTIAAVSVATKTFFILIAYSSFISIVFINDLFYISYISQY